MSEKNIKYDYQMPIVPIIAGTMNKINAHIQNITEKIKAIEQLKPNVSFVGTEIEEKCNSIFYFQVYDYVQADTLNTLKKNCMTIIKSILTDARTNIRDENIADFNFEFEKDDIKVIHSAGKNSKSYIDYSQYWTITLK